MIRSSVVKPLSRETIFITTGNRFQPILKVRLFENISAKLHFQLTLAVTEPFATPSGLQQSAHTVSVKKRLFQQKDEGHKYALQF